MNETIQTITVYALPVLFAITLHEAAHAYAAKYFGDTTAYAQGRMSLNPLKHFDLMGTLVIPVMVLIVSQGAFLFGSAKPVPVNWGALRHPKRDMAWVALAGPGANFIMALLWMLFSLVLLKMGVVDGFFNKMGEAGWFANLILLAFNLLPIPPLDGSRVIFSILPNKLAYQYGKLERYGFFIVLALVMINSQVPILGYWMRPVMQLADGALQLVLLPFVFLLNLF